MTKEEVLKKYGDIPLKFHGYYKYVFTFAEIAEDGTEIVVEYGGCSDEIYRFELTADTTMSLNEDCFSYITLKRNGNYIYDENNY